MNNPWHLIFAQHLDRRGWLSAQDLALRLLPAGCARTIVNEWCCEVALQADLMVLRGELVAAVVGTERLYRLGRRFPLALRAKDLPSATAPSRTSRRTAEAAFTLMLAACAHQAPQPLPSYFQGEDGPLPARRLDQFGLTQGAVYRFCTDDCPAPTPKRWASATPFAPIEPVASSPLAPTETSAPNGNAVPNVSTLVRERIAAQLLGQGSARRAPEPVKAPKGTTRDSGAGTIEPTVRPSGSEAKLPPAVPRAQTTTPASATADTPAALLEAWLVAWRSRDTDAYFALYAPHYIPQDGSRYADWQRRRGAALARTTRIEAKIDAHSVRVSGNRASVRFWQTYASPRFKSRVLKSLELVREGDAWKIRRERVISLSSDAALRT